MEFTKLQNLWNSQDLWRFVIFVKLTNLPNFREVFGFFIFSFLVFSLVSVMVCADTRPSPKNCGFLVREKILGVSGRGCGYIGFGLVFWEPPGKMTENA
jgi:hypothetical protein